MENNPSWINKSIAGAYALTWMTAHVAIVVGAVIVGKAKLLPAAEAVCTATAECDSPKKIGDHESPYGFPENNGESPIDGWEWRGKGEPGSSEGQWVNPDAPKENLHYDSDNHLKKSPDGHWDYRDPEGNEYWVWPDDSMTPK